MKLYEMSENTIENLIKILRELEVIGRAQIQEIDCIGEFTLSNPSENHKRAVVLTAQKLYLKNFWDYASFFLKKFKSEEDENYHFLVPLLRILIEIYIEFFYLVNQKRDKQTILCISEHLFTLAKSINTQGKNVNEETRELINLYKKSHQEYISLTKELNINIPRDPYKFSRNFRDDNNLSFPPVEQMIKERAGKINFVKCSKITRGLFRKLNADSIYSSFSRFSDYVHGNIFFLDKGTHSPANEKLWFITYLQIFSLLISELCDKKITNNSKEKILQDLVKKLKKESDDFVKLWRQKKSIQKQREVLYSSYKKIL